PTGDVDRGYFICRSGMLTRVSVGSLPVEDVSGQGGKRPVQDRSGLAEEAVEGGGPIGWEVGLGGPPADGLGQGGPRRGGLTQPLAAHRQDQTVDAPPKLGVVG